MNRPPSLKQVRLFQEIGRRLDAKGFIASNDGNLSLREPDGTFLVTARGARKGYLETDEIVRVDAAGSLLHGRRAPSTETGMHLAIYRARPDLHAVVHAHPPVATGFSVAREPMDACILPEIILTLGSVPIAPYSTPGTAELGDQLLPHVRRHDVILLANHGAVACGPDLEEAYFRMERLEHTARILLAARLLGRVEVLGSSEVERLLRTGPALREPGLPCRPAGGSAAPPEGVPPQERDIDSASPEIAGSVSGPGLERESWGRIAALITEVLVSRGLSTRGKE